MLSGTRGSRAGTLRAEAGPAIREEPAAKAPADERPKWLRRLGAATFLLFFVKGLLWLVVPALALWFGAPAP